MIARLLRLLAARRERKREASDRLAAANAARERERLDLGYAPELGNGR